MLTGILTLLGAGICQGSFGIGYKKFTPFSWEAFWGVYSTYCVLIPLLWTFIQVPDFMSYLAASPADKIIVPICCGFLWGISAVGFSKAVSYIGVSLVYGLSMGISAVVGSLIPLFTGKTLPSAVSLLLLIGMAITLAGITVITKAGMLKDKARKASLLGIVLAALSGLGSGAMNIGFDYCTDIGNAVMSGGYTQVGASAVQWLLVLCGGFISSTGCCVILLFRNKTWHTYVQKHAGKRLLILLLTCVVWFTALAAYGIASILLGEMGSVIGWILFNALALIVSNCWGLRLGEWKCDDNIATKRGIKPKALLLIGDGILIISWIFIALSGLF